MCADSGTFVVAPVRPHPKALSPFGPPDAGGSVTTALPLVAHVGVSVGCAIVLPSVCLFVYVLL